MNNNRYIKRFISVISLCLCLLLVINVDRHYSDMPQTTISYLGDMWVISSTNGIMNYTRNGLPINILTADANTKKAIGSLSQAVRYYEQTHNIGASQLGGYIDLNAYAPLNARNNSYYKNAVGNSNATTPTPSTPAPSTPKVETKCEHVYKEEITKEATCKEVGVKTFVCEKCNNKYTEEIPVTEEHKFKEEVTKEPTCTEEGISANVCEVCGLSEETPIPKLEHDYGEEITKNPTCTENGAKTFTCKLCGDTYTEDIEATGHTEGQFELTKPNGLFSSGEQVKKCTVCGEVLETEVIPSKFQMFLNKFKK